MAKKKTTDAALIIDQMIGDDAGLQEMIEQETINSQVAHAIYKARMSAKLTQADLAALIGTTQSVIARLEDADYEGHSLSALRRIADALGNRLEIRLVPERSRTATRRSHGFLSTATLGKSRAKAGALKAVATH